VFEVVQAEIGDLQGFYFAGRGGDTRFSQDLGRPLAGFPDIFELHDASILMKKSHEIKRMRGPGVELLDQRPLFL
jgi:hypothetical protein